MKSMIKEPCHGYIILQEDSRNNSKEIFEKFHDCWDEYVSLAEAAIFEYAFRLGARLALEKLQDTEQKHSDKEQKTPCR